MLASFSQQFAPLAAHLLTIKDGSQRIKTIVQDLRTFTQLDCAEQQNAKITDLLRATVNLVRSRYLKIIDFELNFGPTPAISCYPARLNQVFMNLIINSCHAIEAKPNKERKGQIIIDCKVIDNKIEITIADNGCGMSEQTKQHLFEPFYTTKEVGEGTGLGLSISFGIIRQHRGSIEVSSTEEVGTSFKVLLPL
jgi:signal transduction histidine kinase